MEKILVVEDDADIQEVLKNYLMAEGYEVRRTAWKVWRLFRVGGRTSSFWM